MATPEKLHEAAVRIGRSNPQERQGASKYLKLLDYSVLQKCIHCGMCLPTCPTYDETKLERNSPRGRIALMRRIADGQLEVTQAFGQELYFCLGCLTCETVCPAGVRYGEMFEHGRADIEQAGVMRSPQRDLVRALTLRWLFTNPQALRALGRVVWFYQASGLESLVRRLKLTAVLPPRLRALEPLTPRVQRQFSDALIRSVETPAHRKHRVGLLTGCVQDLAFSHVNRDTADALLANGCEVVTPRAQSCCGSIHAHNGELELARQMARRTLDAFDLDRFDAIITNAAGCGTHLKNYGHLLHDDPLYAKRAAQWSAKLRDIHQWLVEIGIRIPAAPVPQTVTYHEACHLCHGQKITRQPRQVLSAIPGLTLVELPESTWCCGSAGIYNITQPEMSQKLLGRKISNIEKTGAAVVASANPGCSAQLQAGVREANKAWRIVHPISLLAEAYRKGLK
ncbi:MAG: 4Fe-4S dicluster domain-containing protein [Acetobacteraceae bacterium]|nr:4Fe-4S dicluster domain-containing protein [Acetobacteraceae bacterium]